MSRATHSVLQKDDNGYPVMGGVSSSDNTLVKNAVIDSVTGRLYTDNGGGGGGNNFIYNEVVSGSGTSFTLAHTPVTGLVSVYGAGQKLFPTNDYTISGAVITTVNTWNAGDIISDYQY